MTSSSIGTPEQLRDPNYTPPLSRAIPLGIQHVLAMFVSNVTPAIIIAGAAGFGFGSNSPDFPQLLYLIQMSMLFAGVATLLQTITLGPVGAGLPIVQGTSFAFIPIMIPLVAGKGVDGLAALFGGIVIGGLFHAVLGLFIGKIRFALPPLVTGLVVTMIGLALVKVGIQYAAGGVPAIGTPEYGSLLNWSAALVVIFVTLAIKFFTKGMLSISAVLIGLIVGYFYAVAVGILSFGGDRGVIASWNNAAWVALPDPFRYGFEFSAAAVIGFCLMAFISAIETVGEVSGITKGGAGREATDRGRDPGRDLCRWFRHRGCRYLRRLSQHLVQPECRPDRNDRCHEPPRGDLWRDFPDHLRSCPQGRRDYPNHPDRSLGRRCHRHVRYGCRRRHVDVVRRRLESPQHGDLCDLDLHRSGAAT